MIDNGMSLIMKASENPVFTGRCLISPGWTYSDHP